MFSQTGERKLKEVLIIGRQGQVSQYLQRSLSKDYKLIVLGSDTLDLTRDEDIVPILSKYSPDIVINPAAYTAVDLAEKEVAKAQAINHIALSHIAEYCVQNDVPLIHFSTDYVFDGTSNIAYTEEDECKPLGVYGTSKLQGEQVVLSSSADAFVLRTSWVYSNIGKNFYNTMLALAERHKELSVVWDQFGSPTYAGAIADTTKVLIDKLIQTPKQTRALKGLYHFTCQGKTNWCDFAKAIFTLHGMENLVVHAIPTEQYPTLAERPKYSVLDTSKLKQRLGLSLPHWRDALQACVDEELVNE